MKLLLARLPEASIWQDAKLTTVAKSYYWELHGIHLHDEYDGTNDGLVHFDLSYNTFHNCYRFNLCGGTRYQEKANRLRTLLESEGYWVDKDTHSWVWGEDDGNGHQIQHVGVSFNVDGIEL